MAISTYKSFLMKGTESSSSTTYAKLIDVKNFSDLGKPPEQIDVTTLSDSMRHYIPGIEDVGGGITFVANYTAADFTTLKALADTETPYAVWFGGTVSAGVATPTGSDGKFSFKGYLHVTKNGGEVNAAQEMTITIFPTTDITFSAGA